MTKKLLFFAAIQLLTGSLSAASITRQGQDFLIRGNNYEFLMSGKNGTLSNMKCQNQPLPVKSHKRGFWEAAVKGKHAAFTAGKDSTFRAEIAGNELHCFITDPAFEAKVVIRPADTYADFIATVTAKGQTVTRFSAPCRLAFDAQRIDGFTADMPWPNTIGATYLRNFFLDQTKLAVPGMLSLFAVGNEGADLLFGQGAIGAISGPRPVKQRPGKPEVWNEWLSPATQKKVAAIRFFDYNPFEPGKADVVLLRDPKTEQVSFGGVRFGGKGLYLRYAGETNKVSDGDLMIEIYGDVAAKLKADGKFGTRSRCYLLDYPNNSSAIPGIARWKKILARSGVKFMPVRSPQEFASILRSPDTALIVNPGRGMCYSAPNGTLKEILPEIRRFVQQGGFWFDAGRRPFREELSDRWHYAAAGAWTVPGSFADFGHLRFANGTQLAVCAVRPMDYPAFAGAQDRSKIYVPSRYMFGGEPSGGFYFRDYCFFLRPGEPAVTLPATRFRFGMDALAAAKQFARDNAVTKPLSAKLSPELYEKVRRSVLVNPQTLAPRFRDMEKWVGKLPAPCIFNLCDYMHGGFDKEYPDLLPPNPQRGTLTEMQHLAQSLHDRGILLMPYVNSTWWSINPDAPSLKKYGTKGLALRENGEKIMEDWGGNCGYTACMWAPESRRATLKFNDDFTKVVPCDLLFHDQIGARSPILDFNPASPTPYAYTEGLISTARENSRFLPYGTEQGWWGAMVDHFLLSGFTQGMNHYWYRLRQAEDERPLTHWRYFPLVQAIGHECCLITQHNGVAVRNFRDVGLVLSCGYGFNYSFDTMYTYRKGEEEKAFAWLAWLDVLQKNVAYHYVGQPVTKFSHKQGLPGEVGIMKAVYGPVRILANMRDRALRMKGGIVLSPDGWYAVAPGVVTGRIDRAGALTAPGSTFLVKGDELFLFASPGSTVVVPLEQVVQSVTLNGETLSAEIRPDVVRITLPDAKEKYPRVWRLKVVR